MRGCAVCLYVSRGSTGSEAVEEDARTSYSPGLERLACSMVQRQSRPTQTGAELLIIIIINLDF